MKIEYIISKHTLFIQKRGDPNPIVSISNVNHWFAIVTLFGSESTQQWIWKDQKDFIENINHCFESGNPFIIQINSGLCETVSSKFIETVRNKLFPSFQTTVNSSYNIFVGKADTKIKSTNGIFIRFTITLDQDVAEIVQYCSADKIQQKIEEEINIIDQNNQFIKNSLDGVTLREAAEKEREELLKKIQEEQEKRRENVAELEMERLRVIDQSKEQLRDQSERAMEEMREKYQKELEESKRVVEERSKLFQQLDAERVRLQQLASNIFEKQSSVDNKKSDPNSDVASFSEEEMAQKEAKLLQKHNEMQRLLDLEKAKQELNHMAYVEEERIRERVGDQIGDQVGDQVAENQGNDKADTDNLDNLDDPKLFKNSINQIKKNFKEKIDKFGSITLQESNFLHELVDAKIKSVEESKKSLQYIEQLNNQKEEWVKIMYKQLEQNNIDQKDIDQQLSALEDRYRDEAMGAVELFKNNIGTVVSADKIKEDIANIIKFREEQKRLNKLYQEEEEKLRKTEEEYNEERTNFLNTIKQIVEEWDEKSKEEYLEEQKEERERLEKLRIRDMRRFEKAMEYNFNLFMNKCEHAKEKIKFDKLDQIAKEEEERKKRKLVIDEMEKRKKEWEMIQSEKDRLNQMLRDKRQQFFEDQRKEIEMEKELRRELKRKKLEDERKRVREAREARRKVVKKSLIIW